MGLFSQDLFICENCGTEFNAPKEIICPSCGVRPGAEKVKTIDSDLNIIESYKVISGMKNLCAIGNGFYLFYNNVTKIVYMGFEGRSIDQSFTPFYSTNGNLLRYNAELEKLEEVTPYIRRIG